METNLGFGWKHVSVFVTRRFPWITTACWITEKKLKWHKRIIRRDNEWSVLWFATLNLSHTEKATRDKREKKDKFEKRHPQLFVHERHATFLSRGWNCGDIALSVSFLFLFLFLAKSRNACLCERQAPRGATKNGYLEDKLNGLIKQRLTANDNLRELPFIYYLYGPAVWSQTATAELSSVFEWASSVRLCQVKTSVFPLLGEEVEATTSRNDKSTNRKPWSLMHVSEPRSHIIKFISIRFISKAQNNVHSILKKIKKSSLNWCFHRRRNDLYIVKVTLSMLHRSLTCLKLYYTIFKIWITELRSV